MFISDTFCFEMSILTLYFSFLVGVQLHLFNDFVLLNNFVESLLKNNASLSFISIFEIFIYYYFCQIQVISVTFMSFCLI